MPKYSLTCKPGAGPLTITHPGLPKTTLGPGGGAKVVKLPEEGAVVLECSEKVAGEIASTYHAMIDVAGVPEPVAPPPAPVAPPPNRGK